MVHGPNIGQIQLLELAPAMAAWRLVSRVGSAFDVAIDIYTTDGPNGCFVLCTAPADALTNPVWHTILDQWLEAIDAFFLRRLELEKGRMKAKPADLPVLAALLGAMLHSLALRARAGWSPKQLRSLAAAAVRQVISARRIS